MSSALAHERQPDVVDLVRRRPLQVGEVLFGQGRHAQARAGTLIPWFERMWPGKRDLEPGPPGPSSRPRPSRPCRRRRARSGHSRDRRPVCGRSRSGDGRRRRGPARRQNEFRILITDDHAAGDLAQPDLRTAQVLQHRELSPVSAAIRRIISSVAVCCSCEPCEKLSRNTSTPASTMLSRRPGRSTPARSSPRSWSAPFQIALYVCISSKSRFGDFPDFGSNLCQALAPARGGSRHCSGPRAEGQADRCRASEDQPRSPVRGWIRYRATPIDVVRADSPHRHIARPSPAAGGRGDDVADVGRAAGEEGLADLEYDREHRARSG